VCSYCVEMLCPQIRLMKEYFGYTFACSQAQQFAWVKQDCPELFQEIVQRVKAGTFVPVGGTWIEVHVCMAFGVH